MGVLDHENIFTRKFKTRKFYNMENFQIYGNPMNNNLVTIDSALAHVVL